MNKKDFISYKKAKSYLKSIPVASNRQFRKWAKGNLEIKGLPAFNKKLPKRPDAFYKEWKGWEDFLTASQKKRACKNRQTLWRFCIL